MMYFKIHCLVELATSRIVLNVYSAPSGRLRIVHWSLYDTDVGIELKYVVLRCHQRFKSAQRRVVA